MSHHETAKLQENLNELKNKNSQQLLTVIVTTSQQIINVLLDTRATKRNRAEQLSDQDGRHAI